MDSAYTKARKRMVADHLVARDIVDARVLAAMEKVERELFVPQEVAMLAYLDRPLPIGEGQTISQPYIVALMAQALALDGTERLLEVGGGCGYSAAVYGQLAKEVDSYEIIMQLARHARDNIDKAKATNVHVFTGDATAIEGEELYDAISVAAAPETVPPALMKLLKKGGRMVIPTGQKFRSQRLLLVTKDRAGRVSEKSICNVVFVPLIEPPSLP